MSRRNTLLTLVLALLIASILRLWQLDSLPPGFYHDEAYNALDALALLEGRTFPQFHEGWELYRIEAHSERGPLKTTTPIFFEGNFGREPLHVYLMALSIHFFGATPFAVRLVPALAGILTTLTTAWTAWQLAPIKHRSRIAAYTAIACAILSPAIHFSRFGLRAMLFVPVETLCVAFFWRALNPPLPRGRAEVRGAFPSSTYLNLTLSGLLLGAGLYIYAAARMMPLLFLIFCLWHLWANKKPLAPTQRALLGQFTLMAAVALLVALPLLLYYAGYPYFLFFRSAYVAQNGAGVVSGQPWLTAFLNTGRVLRGFLWLGETHLRHNLPGRPYFDPIQLLLALIGLLICLKTWAPPKRIFLLLWGGVMLLPSILSGDAPHFGRLTGFVPIAAILFGIGAAWLHNTLTARSSAPVATGLLTLCFLTSTLITTRDYFFRYAEHPHLSDDFYQPDWQLGQWMADQPDDSDLFLTPARQHMATFDFALAAGRDRLRNYAGEAGSTLYGNPNTPTYHLSESGNTAVFERLLEFGEEVPVPVEGWRAVRVRPILYTPDAVIGDLVAVSAKITPTPNSLEVTLRWRPTQLLPSAYTAFVHMLAPDGSLVAQNDHPPSGYPTTEWQPGEIIEDHFNLDQPLCPDCTLVTGFYDPQSNTLLGESVTLPQP